MARQARPCHPWHMHATVVLGQQGRVVIPADLRAKLGLTAGDRLHLQISGRRLVIESQKDAAAELRGLASGVAKSRSLVAELLAERHQAAASE